MATRPAMMTINDSSGTSVVSRTDYDAISKRNSEESPLLKLPSEIRNMIWEHFLGEIGPFDVQPYFCVHYYCYDPAKNRVIRHSRHGQKLARAAYSFALLNTCRQVLAETSVPAYRMINFVFTHSVDFNLWTRSRFDHQKNAVLSLTCRYCSHEDPVQFVNAAKGAFPNLKTIHVELDCPWQQKNNLARAVKEAGKREDGPAIEIVC